jgi:hypothetical protein
MSQVEFWVDARVGGKRDVKGILVLNVGTHGSHGGAVLGRVEGRSMGRVMVVAVVVEREGRGEMGGTIWPIRAWVEIHT